MRKRKSTILSVSLVLMLFLGSWYFFLKRWDYKVIFTVKAPQTMAYTFIKDHFDWNGKTLHKGQLVFSDEKPWKVLRSELKLDDTTRYTFDWELTVKNDSTARIVVGATKNDGQFTDRLAILFSKTAFEKDVRKNMRIIRDKINERNKEFRYSLVGKDSLPEVPCVFISSRSSVRGKADEMIKNVIALNMFVKQHELGLNGDPMVVVKNWTPKSDSIDFDFCFPISHPERIPEHPDVGLRMVSVPLGLRADYYGNYSYSDYTWSYMYEMTQKEGLKPGGQIVEVFYNDPHSGGNDLNWKAGIYLFLTQ